MSEHQQLLDEARAFCDPETGEVVERIPDELMTKLRTAKLARGIPGKFSDRTESNATWFVFFNSEIQDRVLSEWRKVNADRKRARGKGRTGKSPEPAPVGDARPKAGRPSSRGLKQFRQRKKPAG